MDEKIRFSGWAAWLDGDSIWWCQDEHSGSAPMQPRTGFEEDMLDEIRRLRTELAACRAALELIAAPQRSDGSWNRDREACRQVAQAALAAKEE